MSFEDVSINWNREAGTGSSKNVLSANHAPMVYKQGNDGTRCIITLLIPKASQASIVCNAKSCEIYELDELGRQEYQGCHGLPRDSIRWELNLAGKVSIAHHVLLHQQYCSRHIKALSHSLQVDIYS